MRLQRDKKEREAKRLVEKDKQKKQKEQYEAEAAAAITRSYADGFMDDSMMKSNADAGDLDDDFM